METILYLIYMVVFLTLAALAAVLIWGVIGFIIGVVHFILDPPPEPPPGPCANCVRLQALWDRMNVAEHWGSWANFLLASAVCAASGSGWLTLVP